VKENLGDTNALYPLVTAIVGSVVDGKPDFATIAHVGIAHLKGITLGMGKVHLTNEGIKANREFSGLFKVFYGELPSAPLIDDCPVTMACRLIEYVELATHDLFVGEIVETHADVEVLTNGIVDIAKVKPLLFDMASKKYWSLGEPIAKCWSVGKGYTPK